MADIVQLTMLMAEASMLEMWRCPISSLSVGMKARKQRWD